MFLYVLFSKVALIVPEGASGPTPMLCAVTVCRDLFHRNVQQCFFGPVWYELFSCVPQPPHFFAALSTLAVMPCGQLSWFQCNVSSF